MLGRRPVICSTQSQNLQYIEIWKHQEINRARICRRLRSPGIDSKVSIPPANVAWRAGTSNRIVVPARQAWNRFLGSLKDLQRWAQGSS
jgi:hypothetical protein